jgi:hypothetical protein
MYENYDVNLLWQAILVLSNICSSISRIWFVATIIILQIGFSGPRSAICGFGLCS